MLQAMLTLVSRLAIISACKREVVLANPNNESLHALLNILKGGVFRQRIELAHPSDIISCFYTLAS